MATICLLFNLLGLATAVTGILTAFNIFPAFLGADIGSDPALLTAVFWWAVSIILLLSATAFGVYKSSETPVNRYDRDLPPQP